MFGAAQNSSADQLQFARHRGETRAAREDLVRRRPLVESGQLQREAERVQTESAEVLLFASVLHVPRRLQDLPQVIRERLQQRVQSEYILVLCHTQGRLRLAARVAV